MSVIFDLGVIIFSSIAIYFAGSRFAESSSRIGDFLRLPKDVKGATFDAISSSLPELLVALYSVVFFHEFEVGIGTIAGSALFNLLVIPGICVFVSPIAFKVGRKVLSRDALFYLLAVFILIVCLIYFKTWGLVIALILIFFYLIYIKEIIKHTRAYRLKKRKNNRKIGKEVFFFFLFMAVIGVFTFFLTNSSISLANSLRVPSIIIAFTLIAAATSVPDTVISVVNARKGSLDDATSNVFGSNIFNIFIGIGLPLLIYFFYKGAVGITFSNLEIVLGLLGSTILILYFFGEDHKLERKEAAILLLMYIVFVAYTIFIAIR